jgi:hypothetical protein
MTNAARAAARSFSLLPEFPTGAEGRQPSSGEGEIALLDVKPAVALTLPWAGVTPAPSEKRVMLKTTFRSQVRFLSQLRSTEKNSSRAAFSSHG